MWRCLCHPKRTRSLGKEGQKYWCVTVVGNGVYYLHCHFILDLYNELVKSTHVDLRERGMKKVSIASVALSCLWVLPPLGGDVMGLGFVSDFSAVCFCCCIASALVEWTAVGMVFTKIM